MEQNQLDRNLCPALQLNGLRLDSVDMDCHLLTRYISVASERENSKTLFL